MSSTTDDIRTMIGRWADSPMKEGVVRFANAFTEFERHMDGIGSSFEEIRREVAAVDSEAEKEAQDRQSEIGEPLRAIGKAQDELSRDLARMCQEDDEAQRAAYKPSADLLSEYDPNRQYAALEDRAAIEKLHAMKGAGK